MPLQEWYPICGKRGLVQPAVKCRGREYRRIDHPRGIRGPAADAGYAGVGRFGLDRRAKPIEIIMACAAGRISIGE